MASVPARERSEIIERGPQIVDEARRIIGESHLVCEGSRTIVVGARRLTEHSIRQRAVRAGHRDVVGDGRAPSVA